MIVVCTNCSARLQINEDKAPAGPFNTRCPKCHSSVNSGPRSPTTDKSTIASHSAPAIEQLPPEAFEPTAPFDLAARGTGERPGTSPVEELGRLLSGLLAQNSKSDATTLGSRPSWNSRRALLCLTEIRREVVAEQLVANNYQVFVAQNFSQAVAQIRDSQLDVVLLDAEFDAGEQGAAFVTRELNILRPAQRRRLFFVFLSPTLRTMESHAAFLHNVNAIVNFKDIAELPRVLEQTISEYNKLYKEFNAALKLNSL